jgi:hypothetical protein
MSTGNVYTEVGERGRLRCVDGMVPQGGYAMDFSY